MFRVTTNNSRKRLVEIVVVTERAGRAFDSRDRALIDPERIESVVPAASRHVDGCLQSICRITMCSGDQILAAMTIHEIAEAITVREIDE